MQNKKYSIHVMKYLAFSYISNDLIANGHQDTPDTASILLGLLKISGFQFDQTPWM